MFRRLLLMSVVCVASLANYANASVIYVEAGTNQFGTIDPTTGAYHYIGTTTVQLGGLGFASDGRLYGLAADSMLYIVNTATAELTSVGLANLGPRSSWGMGATSDGTLYANWSNNIYVINPQNAASTLVGPLGVVTGDGMSGDGSGHLYIGKNTAPSGLLSVDRTTGQASSVGGVNTNYDWLFGMAFTDGTMYGLRYDNGQIFALDLSNGNTTLTSTYDVNAAGHVYAAAAQISTVPEPTTLIIWSLLGAAGIGLGWWRGPALRARLVRNRSAEAG
jgi:hypothetical protein